jgi:signal transduction histidine kinase
LVFALIYELVRRAALSRLYKANDSLSRVSGQLVEKKKETDDILSSVLEGIFLLDKDHKLGEAHSKKFEELLERECVVGEDFTALLSPALGERDCTAVEDYLELLLAGTVNEELLAEINPLAEASLEFARPDGSPAAKRLRFQFIKVASGEATYPIMGVIEDATGEFELKRLMEESEIEHKRSMESLFQIIHVDPAMMSEFIADSEAELEGINDLMREERLSGKPLLEALYQSMHAVKGNAALLGLEEFSKKIHAHEDKIKQKLEQGYEWRDILELTIGLGDIKRELDAIKALIEKVLRFQVASTKAGVKEGNLLAYSIEKIVKRESARTGVPAAANIEGMVSSKIPDVYRKLVKDAIAQFVRNSFAHGFESLETRVARGKEAEGRIILSIERGAKTISIRYADDGAGLDPEILRLRARAMPEFSECADAMTPIDLAKLIFLPGFSTAADTSLSAGRGVGLALVKNRVNEAGGKILVRSARGRSLEFSIMLPLAESKHAEAVS